VLVPRPETELLVEQALARIPEDASWQIADLGTGAGAIALAIAHERPRCRIIATDVSVAALEVARANAVRLNIRNVDFRQGDWLGALQGERFDMIVSNPPYVRDNDPHLPALRFEPTLALTAGVDGLQCLRDIATQARKHFTPGGWLLLEHGYDQGAELLQMLAQLEYKHAQDYMDLANIPRLTVAQWIAPHA
jgi:release factor glutamine methyltransferase